VSGNRTKLVGITTPGEWLSWKGSEPAKYIRFVESYLTLPVGRTKFILHPYQREWFEEWLADGTSIAMLKVARGNAKSTTTAGFALAHLFLTEDADIPVVASTVGQITKTVYGPMVRMVELNPELEGRVLKFSAWGSTKMTVPSMNSMVYPLADNPDSLQGLNPSLAILDEASVASQETWDALVLASGKRDRSLVLGLSTPSFKKDNPLLTMELAYKAGKALPGFTYREYAAPEGCATDDQQAWYAANPGLSTTPPVLKLSDLITSQSMTAEAAFRVYRLAQWVDEASECWLGENGRQVWANLADPDYTMQDQAPTWVGVDMALRHDTCAVVVGQLKHDGRVHAEAKIWYPDKDKGIDIREVMAYLRGLHKSYDLQGVFYDPKYFEYAALDLEDAGLPMVEYSQHPSSMTPAVGYCYEAITTGMITHNADPAFTTQVLNAVPRETDTGFTLSKKASGNKIDAAIALCLMYRASQTTQVKGAAIW
jgi:phage terminase large subunit-like protein